MSNKEPTAEQDARTWRNIELSATDNTPSDHLSLIHI